MTSELYALSWSLVLALVQIFIPAGLRNKETGIDYNAGPRDEQGPPVGVLTGRMRRAQQNLFETLPLFAAGILTAHIAGREGTLTLWGAWTYLIARVIYVPLYWFGIPKIRTLVWMISLVGLVLVLAAILMPS